VLGFDHQISSDVEWMLQSGQATADALLEVLVPEYYPAVLQLALAWLGEEARAKDTARQAFVGTVLHLHAYRQAVGVRAWVFREAVAACRQAATPPKNANTPAPPVTPEFSPDPSDKEDTRQDFDGLLADQRQVVLLVGLSGLSLKECAYALRIKPEDAGQLWRLALAGMSGNGGDGEIDPAGLAWLQERFPLPIMDPAELTEIAAWAAGEAGQRSRRRRISLHLKEVAFVGATIAAVGVIIWFATTQLGGGAASPAPTPDGVTPVPRQSAAYLLQPGESAQQVAGLLNLPADSLAPAGSSSQPGELVNLSLDVFTPTVTTPLPTAALLSLPPLTRRSDTETIRRRLIESPALWRSLWLQTETLDYGPAGYIGPPVGSRAQAWIDQPDHSLELVGQLDGQVDRVYLVEGGRQYQAVGAGGQLAVQPWQPEDALLQSEPLASLAYPGTGGWMLPGGVFETVAFDRVAGRRALVVDWRHPLTGERNYRLWLDADTAVVLRLQEYGGGDGQTLVREVLVNEARFDGSFPPALFDPRTAGLQGFAQDELGNPLRFAQSLELVPVSRPAQPYSPAPANLDTANSDLVFQFPLNLDATTLYSGTQTIPADLFAGGYFLGRVPFGLPWAAVCARSPNGQRLVFATEPASQRPFGQVGWFNLDEPDRAYFPAPGFTAYALAFGPDNQHVALFGRDFRGISGIYLLDLATGSLDYIYQMGDASSLVWSPDGRYLALLGKEDPRYTERRIIVLNLGTHQLTYSEPYQPGQPVPPDAPMLAWAGKFPLPDNPYACVAAPNG
jgi:DNA-directed RNA polymerase specialized sigma24 family protein